MENLTIVTEADEYNEVFEKALWTHNEVGNYSNGDEKLVSSDFLLADQLCPPTLR